MRTGSFKVAAEFKAAATEVSGTTFGVRSVYVSSESKQGTTIWRDPPYIRLFSVGKNAGSTGARWEAGELQPRNIGVANDTRFECL